LAEALRVVDNFLKLPYRLVSQFLTLTPQKIAAMFEHAVLDDIHRFLQGFPVTNEHKQQQMLKFIKNNPHPFSTVLASSSTQPFIYFVTKHPDVANLLLVNANMFAPMFKGTELTALINECPSFAWQLVKQLHKLDPNNLSNMIVSSVILLALADQSPMFVAKIATRWPQVLIALFKPYADSSVTTERCKSYLKLFHQHRVLAEILFDEDPDNFIALFSHLDGKIAGMTPQKAKDFIAQRSRDITENPSQEVPKQLAASNSKDIADKEIIVALK
jgi:hypothetical protein